MASGHGGVAKGGVWGFGTRGLEVLLADLTRDYKNTYLSISFSLLRAKTFETQLLN